MKFEAINQEKPSSLEKLSPFELTDKVRLREWSFVGIHQYLNACVCGSSDERYQVVSVMSDGDLLYVFKDTMYNEIWTVHIASDGAVLEVDMSADIPTALRHITERVIVDNEDRF